MTCKLPWYILQLKPNAHRIAQKNLERQGIEVFLPRLENPKSKGLLERALPLFPGYAFARLNVASSMLRAVNSTLGVNRVVQFGNSYPVAVSDELVACLASRCNEDGVLMTANNLQINDKVAVLRGPFASFVGRIEEIRPSQRIILLIGMMGREVPVVFDGSDVTRLRA